MAHIFTQEEAAALLEQNPKSLTIPEDTESISAKILKNCPDLEEIYIPKSMRLFDRDAFKNCSSLKTIHFGGTEDEWNKIYRKNEILDTPAKSVICSDKEWIIPEIITGTTKPGNFCFGRCRRYAEKVEIPSEVTEIWKEAFRGCVNLKTISIPKNVTKIGEDAFIDCTSLEEIEIPETVTCFVANDTAYIPFEMFTGCTSLKTVRMHFTQKSLPEHMFTETRYLPEKNEIGISVKKLFTCPSLETVELPVVTTINQCLKGLPSLKTVILPDALDTLEPLDLITIPNTARIIIGENAKLAKVFVKKDGTVIEGTAADGAQQAIPEGTAEIIYVKKSGRLLSVRTEETFLVLPDTIKQIEPNNFPVNIIELKLPESLSKIKLPKKDRYGDYDSRLFCSKNVLSLLEQSCVSLNAEAEKEKKKKEKEAKKQAAGAAESVLLDLFGMDIETKAVTKPRVGSNLTVKLPFDYQITFFLPNKQKPEEKPVFEKLFTVLKTSMGRTAEENLDYLERVWTEFASRTELSYRDKKYGVFDDETILTLLRKKLKEGEESGISNLTKNVVPDIEEDAIRFTVNGRFILLNNKTDFNKKNWLQIDSHFDEMLSILKTALEAKSVEEIQTTILSCKDYDWKKIRTIDNEAWVIGE